VGHTLLEDLDTAHAVAAVRAVAATQPVAGVMSWDESKIVQTAWAAKELGLPGGDPEAVLRCRDKFQTRSALDQAGVAQPAYALVGDVDSAMVAADKIGYPVVLKPRAASASFGVVLVSDAAQLAEHFSYPRDTTVPHMPRYDREVLVEEYLDAPEISVDAAVYKGRVVPAFLGRKEVSFAPYFEETGHYVSHADPLLRDPDLVRAMEAAHAALGYTDGWTHSEFKLTADGPKLIEVNGRLGGDLIPYVGMRASGIDPGLVAADVAAGREPTVTPDRELFGGVRFLYVDRDESVIDSIRFDRDALPPETDLAVVLAAPGDVVSRPPAGIVSGRIAFVTATSPTPDSTRAALDRAQAALRLETH
jgi:biotin carboxylase